MPFAPPVTALFIALTISLTLEFSEPVHWYVQPSSLQASAAPYFVGTKNGFVVTWLTKTNLSFLLLLKMPLAGVPPPPPLDALLEPDPPPHAASAVATSPAAPPVSAPRRVIAAHLDRGSSFPSRASLHSSRSSASCTGRSEERRVGKEWRTW